MQATKVGTGQKWPPGPQHAPDNVIDALVTKAKLRLITGGVG